MVRRKKSLTILVVFLVATLFPILATGNKEEGPTGNVSFAMDSKITIIEAYYKNNEQKFTLSTDSGNIINPGTEVFIHYTIEDSASYEFDGIKVLVNETERESKITIMENETVSFVMPEFYETDRVAIQIKVKAFPVTLQFGNTDIITWTVNNQRVSGNEHSIAGDTSINVVGQFDNQKYYCETEQTTEYSISDSKIIYHRVAATNSNKSSFNRKFSVSLKQYISLNYDTDIKIYTDDSYSKEISPRDTKYFKSGGSVHITVPKNKYPEAVGPCTITQYGTDSTKYRIQFTEVVDNINAITLTLTDSPQKYTVTCEVADAPEFRLTGGEQDKKNVNIYTCSPNRSIKIVCGPYGKEANYSLKYTNPLSTKNDYRSGYQIQPDEKISDTCVVTRNTTIKVIKIPGYWFTVPEFEHATVEYTYPDKQLKPNEQVFLEDGTNIKINVVPEPGYISNINGTQSIRVNSKKTNEFIPVIIEDNIIELTVPMRDHGDLSITLADGTTFQEGESFKVSTLDQIEKSVRSDDGYKCTNSTTISSIDSANYSQAEFDAFCGDFTFAQPTTVAIDSLYATVELNTLTGEHFKHSQDEQGNDLYSFTDPQTVFIDIKSTFQKLAWDEYVMLSIRDKKNNEQFNEPLFAKTDGYFLSIDPDDLKLVFRIVKVSDILIPDSKKVRYIICQDVDGVGQNYYRIEDTDTERRVRVVEEIYTDSKKPEKKKSLKVTILAVILDTDYEWKSFPFLGGSEERYTTKVSQYNMNKVKTFNSNNVKKVK